MKEVTVRVVLDEEQLHSGGQVRVVVTTDVDGNILPEGPMEASLVRPDDNLPVFPTPD